MNAASPRPLKQFTRVYQAVAEGCETSREISSATGIPVRQVRNQLRLLCLLDALVRESRPTFWDPSLKRYCFRYQPAGGAR